MDIHRTLRVLAFFLFGFAVLYLIHVRPHDIPRLTEVAVTFPEGSNSYDIDRILSRARVLTPGAFAAYAAQASLEGRLFPDTYFFYATSTPAQVAAKMLAIFQQKTAALSLSSQDLIIASLVQREVMNASDMSIVAGIIERRLAAHIPLDIDSTICYIKDQYAASSTNCYPLTNADLKRDSPYNTYLYQGLPPGPISNPGLEAIQAALHPATSSYWYYLSDPATGRTIYAETLSEQNINQKKYLRWGT